MLRQIISEHFQWLPAAPGNSMQHECDIIDWIPMIGPSMFVGMSRRTNPKSPPTCADWRVIIIRSKGEYLGSVEAPDHEKAVAVAIKQFALDDDQRSRLLIRERL
jgi:hypothetical protein